MHHLIAIISLLVFSISTHAKSDEFSGQWRIIAGCPQGYGVAISLIQKGTTVTGTWSDLPFIDGDTKGLNFIGGHEGKIKGKISGSLASVKTCTFDEESKCDFVEAGTIEHVGSNMVWINTRFEDRDVKPERGARLVLRTCSKSTQQQS